MLQLQLLLTKTTRFQRITPVLRNLHWVPVAKRSDCKILTITKWLRPTSLIYCSFIDPCDFVLHLGDFFLEVPVIRTGHTMPVLSPTVAAPCLRNSLPVVFRKMPKLSLKALNQLALLTNVQWLSQISLVFEYRIIIVCYWAIWYITEAI